jgi:soluble cytochrome b562
MDTYIFNFYPIFKMICILFAIIGAYSTINNFMHLFARFGKDKLDNKKDIHAKDCDTDVTQDLIQTMQAKYPDVKKEFIILPEKEQNIENNQEIHDINQKLDILQRDIDEIRRIQRGGL